MDNLEKAILEYETNYIGILELNKKYNIPKEEIRKKLEEKGYFLGKGVHPKSVVNIKRAIDEYKTILNSKQEPNIYHLSQKYNVSHTSIVNNLKRLNISVNRYPKKIQFNEHIFDVIDTEEKAYWLGFFSADGYVCTRYNTVGIALSSVDKTHVQKFAKFLGCESNVKLKKNKCSSAYLCEIGNAHLKQTLKSYGFDEQKSISLKFPNDFIFADKSLIRHFLRGHFDGDGCITFGKYFRKRTNDYRFHKRISVVGTYAFIESWREFFKLWDNSIQKDGNCYSISTETKAQEILEYLYKDATIYLERKYILYKNFAAHFVQTSAETLLKNGESWDANAVVNTETKVSMSPYSVEIEPVNSE